MVLCPSLSESEVRALLPFWPRIYSRASLDHDRRVREAAQRAHLEGENDHSFSWWERGGGKGKA